MSQLTVRWMKMALMMVAWTSWLMRPRWSHFHMSIIGHYARSSWKSSVVLVALPWSTCQWAVGQNCWVCSCPMLVLWGLWDPNRIGSGSCRTSSIGANRSAWSVWQRRQNQRPRVHVHRHVFVSISFQVPSYEGFGGVWEDSWNQPGSKASTKAEAHPSAEYATDTKLT